MENLKQKCSFKKHLDIDAVSYCVECKKFLCNKCQSLHLELFDDHHTYNANKNMNELFTGYCKEKKHNNELEYFCKTHNQLCCAACIARIKGEGNGQHTDCEICLLKDITNEKKNKLSENIKSLEDLFNQLKESTNELKNFFKIISEKKEELKLNVQKIFTKIRTALNEREDELLLEIDNQYNDLFFSENVIKESEKLPDKIKEALDKGKEIDKEWNNEKLSSYIYYSINIENHLKDINEIKEKIEKYKKNKNVEICFNPENDGINKYLESTKLFGNIVVNHGKRIQSKIISLNDLSKIDNWLETSIGNFTKYELIYRATEHGDSNSISFSKCKNIPNLLLIMKDNNNNIFGSFCSIATNTSCTYSKDTKCFLFSLNNNKKYTPNLNVVQNIYHCSSHLVEFGYNGTYDFSVGDKFLTSKNVQTSKGTVFGGDLRFFDNSPVSLTELEAFKVIQ